MSAPRIHYGRADGAFWWSCSQCFAGETCSSLSLAFIAARAHLEIDHATD